MKSKKDIEDEITDFLEFWDADRQIAFLKDILLLFELYDVDDENDWVRDAVGESDERNVRLIRTVYLLSRIADFHAGILCSVNIKFKDLWKKLEKHGMDQPHEV
jgi:hypothetical protein